MVPSLAFSSSKRLVTHPTVGASTGYMTAERGDWPATVRRACAVSLTAVELSALSADELPGLVDYLTTIPSLPFDFVSVHAPSKRLDAVGEVERVELLRRLPGWVDAVVVHPDVIAEPGRWERLGSRLALENMDDRKASGRTLDELATSFARLPEARLCLDVAHAASIDPSMEVALELLDAYRTRMSHLHLSSLDEVGHHVPMVPDDEARFDAVLRRCADLPWLLEAAPPS